MLQLLISKIRQFSELRADEDNFGEPEFQNFALHGLKLNFHTSSWPSYNVVRRLFFVSGSLKLMQYFKSKSNANHNFF